jgi:hypothetical protein
MHISGSEMHHALVLTHALLFLIFRFPLAEIVAEMTGRRGRLVRNYRNKVVLEYRGQGEGDIENLNIRETVRTRFLFRIIPESFPPFSGPGLFARLSACLSVCRVTSCFSKFEGQLLFNIMIVRINGSNMFVIFLHSNQECTANVVINGSKTLRLVVTECVGLL